MGLNTNNNSNHAKIVMIKHNALCLEAKEPTDGYTEKEVTNPTTGEKMIKYIKLFGSLDGNVTKLEFYNTEDQYDQQYIGVNVHMEDAGEEFILQIPHGKQHFNTFCKIAENIDFTDRVEFWADKDRLKDTTKFGASQNGAGVKYRYTKDNPGPMPPATQNKTTKKWDFSKQNEWLLNNLVDNIIPAVNAQLGVSEKAQAAAAGGEDRWADDPDPIHNS